MRVLLTTIACCAVLALPSTVCAGLYHPDALGAFDIDENGNADPLLPDAFLVLLGNVKETDWSPAARLIRPEPPERYVELKQAIEARRLKGISRLSEDEKLVHCADLLRFRSDAGAINQALDILNELSRGRSRDNGFLIYALFAHALKLQGQQGQQRDSLLKATESLSYSFPPRMAGLTPKQIAWYERFEKQYHVPFLSHRVRLGEAAKHALELDPLFRSKETREPVRYVGESGQFEPGTIAVAEEAKLPPDAIAIVQQLILWYPSDERLMWQLAELYNASGDLKTADQLFDLCIRDMHIESQETRDHRTLVKERYEFVRAETQRMFEEKQKAEKEKKRQEAEEKRQREILIGIIVALVVVLLGYWQLRELVRRIRGRRLKATSGPSPPIE